LSLNFAGARVSLLQFNHISVKVAESVIRATVCGAVRVDRLPPGDPLQSLGL